MSSDGGMEEVMAFFARSGFAVEHAKVAAIEAKLGAAEWGMCSIKEAINAVLIEPLVLEVRLSPRDIVHTLKVWAPKSGAMEYLRDLPEAAKQHMQPADWVRVYFEAQLEPKSPLKSLWSTDDGKDFVTTSGHTITSMPIKGVQKEPFLTGPEICGRFQKAVIKCMGPVPEGFVAMFHATNTYHVLSVMANPQHNVGLGTLDFGPAFYCTTRAKAALSWAATKATPHTFGAIVVWYVPSDSLRELSRLEYGYTPEFKRVVRNFRILKNRDRSEFVDGWEGSEYDLITGPVARLKRGANWSTAGAPEIFSLNLKAVGDGAPDFSNQYAFRTKRGISAVFKLPDTKMCAVVLTDPSKLDDEEGFE